jgi:hypothetical protein
VVNKVSNELERGNNGREPFTPATKTKRNIQIHFCVWSVWVLNVAADALHIYCRAMYQLGNTLYNIVYQKWPLALQKKNAWSWKECKPYSILVCKAGEKKTAVWHLTLSIIFLRGHEENCGKKSFVVSRLWNLKFCKSVHHHTIQIYQPTRCNNFSSLLLDVYAQLNMFRASSRPSSGA